MVKRLSKAEFQAAVKRVKMGAQTIDIARAVLVDGRSQTELAAHYGVTGGAVSQVVSKVWEARSVPPGFERITVTLPRRQARLVRQWAALAAKAPAKKT